MKLKKNHFILVLLLFISIGFAVLTSNLGINGIASFTDASFDVHFENAKVEDKNIDDGSITINSGDVSITSIGTFEKPGDYIDTSFYVMNSGTMDASLNTLSVSGLSTELKNYFTYTLKYDIGGSNVARGDILRAGQGRKINLHIEYKYDVETLSSASNLNITITMNYINPKKAVQDTVCDYEYTGGEQYFIANKSGNYRLELWGAQGGNADDNDTSARGGYGGYATGTVSLIKDAKLYINVGGKGEFEAILDINNNVAACDKFNAGGYNGGGRGTKGCNGSRIAGGGGGGGATHVATINGTLEDIGVNNLDKIYIIAGGGGGGTYNTNSTDSTFSGTGGNGGGYKSTIGVNTSYSASNQTNGYQFGRGADTTTDQTDGGGGGGLYGGYADIDNNGHGWVGGNGGSGYIGNANLTDKIMYCYNCQSSENEEDETNIKTRSTTNVSATPTSNYAKIGDGFVRITYLGK